MIMDNEQVLPKGTVLKSNMFEYTVVRTLGVGGFGITYLVQTQVMVNNIPITAHMAVKEHFISSLCERNTSSLDVTFSNPVGDTVARARRAFVKEAQRVQSLGIQHHNIVRINEVFEANNTAYYVMEYLDGETLQEYVKRQGSLSYDETLALMRPIVDAIASLHENYITHYDIKPSNIILTKEPDDTMRPVIIDFGLSKHYDNEGFDTSTINAAGYSSGYAPVEQYAGLKQFTPQADVYALAATIYFCLTGERPSSAEAFDTDLLYIKLRGKVPQEFVDTIHRAMAYSKSKRTTDARTFFLEIYNAETDEVPTMAVYNSETTIIATLEPDEADKETKLSDSHTDILEKEPPDDDSDDWIMYTAIVLIILAFIGLYVCLS